MMGASPQRSVRWTSRASSWQSRDSLPFRSARQKCLLAVESIFLVVVRIANEFPLRGHVPGFRLVFEISSQDVITDHADQVLVLHREVDLNPVIQIARHQIS